MGDGGGGGNGRAGVDSNVYRAGSGAADWGVVAVLNVCVRCAGCWMLNAYPQSSLGRLWTFVGCWTAAGLLDCWISAER